MLKKSMLNFLLLPLLSLGSTFSAATVAAATEPKALAKPMVIILAAKDPVFSIKLQGNPSTGYNWFLVDNYSKDLIRPTQYKYAPGNGKLVGGGGTFEFTFRALPEAFLVPKLLQPLHFVYIRAWEPNNIAQTQDVQVIISH
jgi:predicted secreted protein